MAIKSELIETSKKDEPVNPFPCLRKHKTFGYVVAFTDENTGTVVGTDPNIEKQAATGNHSLFFYSENWTDFNDEDVWAPVEELTVHYHE